MKNVLEIKGIKKAFGKNEVLCGIDFSVAEGEVVALLGPSGSGKTTFLRCINFLERADGGTIKLDGLSADFHKVNKKEIYEIRKKTAMVFQNYDLFLNKTVLENVTEGLIVARKISRMEAINTATKVLEKVGLGERLSTRPYELSGGQQQRVGIARALALNPKIILFDEPTSALDPEKVDEILEIIKSVAKTGMTIVIVTHEMQFAYDVADRVVLMDGGIIIEEGNLQQLLENPAQERTKQFLSRFSNLQRPEYFI